MSQRPATIGTQAEMQRVSPTYALLADLGVLDTRLRRLIEQIRLSYAEGVDPANRGLLIEESDVDAWLASLGTAGAETQPAERQDSIETIGHEGGRLAALAWMFGLSPFERAVLLTALAPEIDLTYGSLYAYAQDDVTKKYPTLDLVLSLWCSTLSDRLEARRLLGPDAPLRRWLLLAVDESNNYNSLLARPLRLDPRISSFLLNTNDPDPALAGSVRIVRREEETRLKSLTLPPTQLNSLERLSRAALERRRESDAARRGLVVWMRGPERLGKRATAEHVAVALGRPLLVVDSTLLLSAGKSVSPHNMIYRALREAQLQGALIFWSDADALAAREDDASANLPPELTQLLSEWAGCAFFDMKSVHPPYLPTGPLCIELDFPAPSNERRRELWEQALGEHTHLAPDVDLALVIGAFRLTGEQIIAAADTAHHSAAWRSALDSMDEIEVNMRDLLSACRTHSNQGLGALAKKITPRYTWADLVVPADRTAQLREMCLHVRYGPRVFEEWGFDRKLAGGKGLNVLFAGEPGTGKTMASEVLATDLGLDLYKIDLSSVVSKYIGETEKNLEKIFREARTSNAILFFDEADSLFGKRSEVKDSHDRYANIEISYLLQRMEEYDGIVILATNFRKNLDDAFVRRLHGAIEFPMPEEADRLQIWRRTFPPEAPISPDADFPFLAKRFKLSGGNIKNIILEAAFFAAEDNTPISMVHLVRATRREHQKIGKLIADTDFGPYARLIKQGE